MKNYKKEHDAFPHESTANQWFSESQFESYRQLGFQVVYSSICGSATAHDKPLEKELHAIFKSYGFKVKS